MKISVVVTNFNYAQYLGRCLRSLIEQDFAIGQYEIVVVDDASTDESMDVIRSFGDSVRCISQEVNVGLGSSLNHGLLSCKGRYVTRVDADDYVHPSFLSTLFLAMTMREAEFDAVASDYLRVSDSLNRQDESYGDAGLEPIGCGILFTHSVLFDLGLYEPGLRLDEDKEFMRRFSAAGYQLLHLPIPLYRYRQHPGSLTRNRKVKK